MFRRFVVASMLVALFLGASPARAAIGGASWILVDGWTGDVLAGSNADAPKPVASLAKMLTALVVRDRTELDEKVRISDAAAGAREDRLKWPKGFTFSVEEVLHGLLMESSNGAAVALAEHVAGSQATFAAMMNSRARDLGATRTVFSNPHGLDPPAQVSTARDMAVIARALLQDPVLARIVRTGSYDIPWLGGIATFHNSTRFLAIYPGSIGVKPGFTSLAGNCLAAAAERNGNRLVAVVLNSPTVTEDVVALMDAWFAKLPPRDPPVEAQVLGARLEKTRAEEEPAPIAMAASAEPDRVPLPADSRVPSIPGTILVLAVSVFAAKNRARERMLSRS